VTRARQTATGLAIAGGVLAAWVGLHVYGVFFWTPTSAGLILAPLIVLALTWLSVGLFITAHDAMHGTLAPGRPGVTLTRRPASGPGTSASSASISAGASCCG
jgi:beta-carotene ketolase (CrtW type)